MSNVWLHVHVYIYNVQTVNMSSGILRKRDYENNSVLTIKHHRCITVDPHYNAIIAFFIDIT